MQDEKEPFTTRIPGSVKDKVKAEAERIGKSINKTAELVFLKGLRYDKDISALRQALLDIKKVAEYPPVDKLILGKVNEALRARDKDKG